MNQKLLEPNQLNLLQNKFLSQGQRFDSQPFMVDRGIVMPDSLHADRQPTAPNESEAARTKPVEFSAEQVPVPRSAIRQSAIRGGPWNCDA
jgi:hypothetical protein